MNTVKKATSIVFASLLSAVIVSPAIAGSMNDNMNNNNMNDVCQMGINTAGMAVQGAQFMGPDAQRNQNMVISTVMAANTMVQMGRFNDAIQQMNAMRNMVNNMAQNQQMNMVDAMGQDMVADGMGGVDGMGAMAIDACQMQAMN